MEGATDSMPASPFSDTTNWFAFVDRQMFLFWRRLVSTGSGAGRSISGVASDGSGLIAVRPGPADDALVYFSPNGLNWQYAATIGTTGGLRHVSQQGILLRASTSGTVQPVSLTSIPGAVLPELSVKSLAVAGGQQVAVGSADGYPAIWQKTSGHWTRSPTGRQLRRCIAVSLKAQAR
jgi:hypothetical protein